jgi:hypothetical protein
MASVNAIKSKPLTEQGRKNYEGIFKKPSDKIALNIKIQRVKLPGGAEVDVVTHKAYKGPTTFVPADTFKRVKYTYKRDQLQVGENGSSIKV